MFNGFTLNDRTFHLLCGIMKLLKFPIIIDVLKLSQCLELNKADMYLKNITMHNLLKNEID